MSQCHSFHSDNKQKIRENYWDSAFDDLMKNDNKSAEEIRYFELPGPECIYIKQVIQKFGIKLENIVGVEENKGGAIPIRHVFKGQAALFEGNLEDICERDTLGDYFPFDIINLDFCGQAFVFNGTYQKRWDVIKYFFDKNYGKKIESFYLLLTLMANRNNKEGMEYLKKQLLPLKKSIGTTCAEIHLDAVPKIIIEEAHKANYKTKKVRRCHYVQEKHKLGMVTFSFKFEKFEDGLADKQTRDDAYADAISAYLKAPPDKIDDLKLSNS